jgi:flagellar hook assembly protein FlgD
MNGSPSSNNQTTSIQNNLSSSLNTASSYPNPFSDVVSLSWNQNQIGRVSIRIFATNGVLTRTMYVGNSEIGTHRTQWDGRDSSGELVSSGTYFAQILVNGVNIAQNIRLVVIR